MLFEVVRSISFKEKDRFYGIYQWLAPFGGYFLQKLRQTKEEDEMACLSGFFCNSLPDCLSVWSLGNISCSLVLVEGTARENMLLPEGESKNTSASHH